jgi:hypothetical protein
MDNCRTCDNRQYVFNRRDMLRTLSCGFGYLAFASMANAVAADDRSRKGPLAPRQPHFGARAKRVIFLCMAGGPSHLDTFDYKPKLIADDGMEAGGGRRRAARLLGSPFKFSQHGESGLWISELFPNVATHADQMCLLRSMHTDIPAHAQAFVQMHTGSFQFVRPSMGAWTLYGLGTENQNLPGFITINPPTGQGGAQNYGSAFLPAICQGMPMNGRGGRRGGDAGVPNIRNSKLSAAGQRDQLDLIQTLNRERLKKDKIHPGVEGVIESFELAFRMQAEVPDVMDINREDEKTRDLYGLDDDATSQFGRQCLLARRCVEAGVRFVEVGRGGWDHHRNLRASLENNCRAIDRPIAGLLTDLQQRGLLEDTLVVWGGEFGRTPYAQNGDGRDHNNKGYTMWMAGGGVHGGMSYGSTDEHGGEAVDNKVHIHDWHATLLHLMGLDHEKLTFPYAGRDFRLTEVYGNVVKDIMV